MRGWLKPAGLVTVETKIAEVSSVRSILQANLSLPKARARTRNEPAGVRDLTYNYCTLFAPALQPSQEHTETLLATSVQAEIPSRCSPERGCRSRA